MPTFSQRLTQREPPAPPEPPQLSAAILDYLDYLLPVVGWKVDYSPEQLAFCAGRRSVLEHLSSLYLSQQKRDDE